MQDNIINFEKNQKMDSNILIRKKMESKDLSKMILQNHLGCCEKTLRKYLNGTTTSGPYLTQLLEILEISIEEWNSCENIKQKEVL